MDYCISAFFKRQDEKIYRVYVTDCLKTITENTARFAGGRTITVRYAELVDRKPAKKEETAESIINRIKSKLKNI